MKYSKLFKKDLKRYKHNHKTLDAAKQMVKRLANDEALEPKHHDHALKGEYTERMPHRARLATYLQKAR